MSYREIPEDRILKFPSTAGFKGWKDYFTKESVAHPAKMNLNLLRHIIESHTRPGDVVLDPMAGTGSTVILASMLGRDGIAVEYEPHFCDMIRENISRAEKQTTFTPKGRIICAQGDARELSKLLKKSDVIITSPPYSKTISGDEEPQERYDKFAKGNWKGRWAGIQRIKAGYSKDPSNIGNLPHGDIEAIITSPPYGAAQSGGGIAVKGYDGPKHTPTDLIGERSYMPDKFEKEDNIGVLEYGDIDAIVSSPPYGNRLSDEAVQDGDPQRMSYRQAVDSIITSPPYEESLTGGGQVDKEGFAQGYTQGKHCFKDGYSTDEDNIGNLKSDSYLEAMLQCYREFYKVLREGGVMVLVTKNFIRDKNVVRLDVDTIKLCEAAGFRLSDRWYFKLPTRSFWRILYERKYPDAPKILYEDVLIFGK